MMALRAILAAAGRAPAGGGGGGGAVTWNPNDKSGSISLSNADLTAQLTSGGGTSRNARATLSRSTGKHYFEVVVDATAGKNVWIGIALATHVLDTDWLGRKSADGWSYYAFSGQKYNNGNATYGNSYITGDVIGVAVDLDAGKIWWAKNNTWQASGDPANGTGAAYTNVSGEIFPALTLYDLNDQLTARFKSADFTYTPPSGFSAWES
jgi:hypothetical protein